jgi:SAM-dependent methyltransferase
MYAVKWHEYHGTKTTLSAEIIIDILISFLDVEAVLDIGCGDGRWLSVCRSKGVATILGVDGPWTDPTGLLVPSEFIKIQDLSLPFDLDRRFSLVICLEVAEHVNKKFSDVFVDNLVHHGDIVLFSAAVPYQGGFRHINEQWQSYWASLFEARGFLNYDPLRGQIWNDRNVHFWYKQNTIMYINKNKVDAIGKVSSYIKQKDIHGLPLDIVHPEMYEVVASYKRIAFKPLAKEFSKQFPKKLMNIIRRKV